MPFRGVALDVLRIINAETLMQTSECFISKFCTRLHSEAKNWSRSLKTSLAEESHAGKRTYAGKRYFSPLPKLEDGLQSFSDECHRYLSAEISVKETWSDKSRKPPIQNTQLALAQLIRTMKACTQSMTVDILDKAYLHLKIAESYCEFDTRFNAVFSALPWHYLVSCRKSIIEETQRNEKTRSDTSKFQTQIRQTKTIADLVEIARSMSDIARVEADSPEVRAKYRQLGKELEEFKWEFVEEGTFFAREYTFFPSLR